MAGGLDQDMAAQFLYTKLTQAAGLAGLTVYEGGAPAGATYPLVTFESVPFIAPTLTAEGVYVLGRARYRVKVHAKDKPFSYLRPYKAAAYASVHRQQLVSVTSGEVYAAIGQEEIREEQDVDGVVYRRAGFEVEITGRSG